MVIDTFLSFAADVTFRDALSLVTSLAPTHLVIRADSPTDDEMFYVFTTEALLSVDVPGGHTSIGDALNIQNAEPAPVDTSGGTQVRAEAVENTVPTVVLENGILTGLQESLPPPQTAEQLAPGGDGGDRDGGGGGSHGGGGGGDGDGGAGAGAGGDAGPLFALAIAVEYARQVVLGETMSLLLRITGDPSAAETIPFAGAAGDHIDVVVSPKSGFIVDGAAEARFEVTGPDPEELPKRITLQATALGSAVVQVLAFRGNEPLGSLIVSPVVVEVGAETGARDTATANLKASGTPSADLDLWIFEQPALSGERELHYRLTARDPALRLNLRHFGPVTLQDGAGAFFRSQYQEIIDLPLETQRLRAIAAERLEAIGSSLYATLFPGDLQALLWGLRDRITTVRIQSDEPLVPWELCRLQGTVDGRVEEGPFFCEAFELTRWIPEIPVVDQLAVSKVALIAPHSGLASRDDEVAMVEALASSTRTVEPVDPNYTAVRSAFGKGTYDAFHFVGHGAFPDQSNPARAEISLDGTQRLRPSDVSGGAQNLGIPSPLVFFNACESGRQAPSLVGAGGWASALLKVGVGAFVGSHWDVTDDLALKFATRFYRELLGGSPFGAAMRTARLAIRDTGDPTWLAYTAFAYPGALVTQQDQSLTKASH